MYNSYEKNVWDSTRKWWPSNTGDHLIQVLLWAGLTVLLPNTDCLKQVEE